MPTLAARALLKFRTIAPRIGVNMFGINKQQQQREESSLCAALVIFNLALLSLFVFVCIK